MADIRHMRQGKPFDIIPDRKVVEELQRELRFFPSENPAPQRLTAADIARFNAEGFISGLHVFEADEIAGYRRYFDRLLAEALEAGADSYSISSAHLQHGRVYDILVEPRIVDVVADLLGENVVGWGSHFFCKMPHDGKAVAWHQDASYWPLSPSKTATVWLAIDDADVENACMRFLPSSHLSGHLPHATIDTQDHVLDQAVENADAFGSPVNIELRAGEISVHSDLLLHGSEANESHRRRCGLTLRYCSAEVRAGMDWHKKGVLVRGSDPSGHWSNPTRPEKE